MKNTNKTSLSISGLCLILLTVLFAVSQARAQGGSIVVNTLAEGDDGVCDATNCTLREAVKYAPAGSTITFSVTGAITLTGGVVAIDKDLTINGPGLGSLTINGNGGGGSGGISPTSIFKVSSGSVVFSGLTLSRGTGRYVPGGTGSSIPGGSGEVTAGGAIFVSGGTVTVTRCYLSQNFADYGGAIYRNGGSLLVTYSTFAENVGDVGGAIDNAADAAGTAMVITNSTFYVNRARIGGAIENLYGLMTIENSTISDNRATFRAQTIYDITILRGGGIYNSGTLTIANSTITLNEAKQVFVTPAISTTGGGICNFGTLNLSNSIVAGNVSNSDASSNNIYNGYGTAGTTTGTYNMIDGDPKLAYLANNGGPTLTHAPLAGSPVIDAGDPNFNPANTPYDQRGPGFPRVVGRLDIGAYETELPTTGSSLIVNTLADGDDGICGSGNCTLREAVKYAVAGATITFSVSGTLTLTQGEVVIGKNLTIQGPASAPGVTVSGNNASRIFAINSGTVFISNLTLIGGNGTGSGITTGNGGAIRNGSILTVTNCTITGNSAVNGGGIRSGVNLTVRNSTITGNTATSGGAIQSAAVLTVTGSTLAGNSASTSGGGIDIVSGSANLSTSLSNSIVAGNVAPTGPDIKGVINSGDYNLVQNTSGATLSGTHNVAGQDPRLVTLKPNGGPAATMALLAGSPAFNAGDPNFDTAAAPYDQRGSGYARKSGSAIDIGAFEIQLSPTAATVPISGHVKTPAGRGITGVILSLTDSNGNVRTVTTTSYGYYQFDDVEVGGIYILSATGKHFTFSQPVQVLNVNEETNQIDFTANSEKRLKTF